VHEEQVTTELSPIPWLSEVKLCAWENDSKEEQGEKIGWIEPEESPNIENPKASARASPIARLDAETGNDKENGDAQAPDA
jgi:hypothetical protein